MLGGGAVGALIVAFLITVLELTEVVAIVYALGASSRHIRPGVMGALTGVAVVSLAALGTGLTIVRYAQGATLYLLIVSSLLLWGFGAFLFRSTVKTYLKEERKRTGSVGGETSSTGDSLGTKALFGGGFSVAAVETLEAMIVLVALTSGGYGWEALAGYLAGGLLLLVLGYLLHERVRRLKVPPLKWVGTSLLFTFAIFWSGESLQAFGWFSWPTLYTALPDVILVPLLALVLFMVRLAVRFRVRQRMRAIGYG